MDGVYRYSSKKSSARVLQTLVGDFVSGVLGGSLAPFAAYLNDAKNIDPEELAELKKIVQSIEQSDARKENGND